MFSSLALVGVLYVFLSYATVVGFDNDAGKLTAASVPMVDAAQGVASFLAFLAYMAGFTSILSSLISAGNSQARIIFSSGREGLLPSVTGRVTARSLTPWVAFLVYLGLALGLTYVFGWNTDPVVFLRRDRNARHDPDRAHLSGRQSGAAGVLPPLPLGSLQPRSRTW